MKDMYLAHINYHKTYDEAARGYWQLTTPAALLRFKDSTGAIAFLESKPLFEGQRSFDAGEIEVRRNHGH